MRSPTEKCDAVNGSHGGQEPEEEIPGQSGFPGTVSREEWPLTAGMETRGSDVSRNAMSVSKCAGLQRVLRENSQPLPLRHETLAKSISTPAFTSHLMGRRESPNFSSSLYNYFKQCKGIKVLI